VYKTTKRVGSLMPRIKGTARAVKSDIKGQESKVRSIVTQSSSDTAKLLPPPLQRPPSVAGNIALTGSRQRPNMELPTALNPRNSATPTNSKPSSFAGPPGNPTPGSFDYSDTKGQAFQDKKIRTSGNTCCSCFPSKQKKSHNAENLGADKNNISTTETGDTMSVQGLDPAAVPISRNGMNPGTTNHQSPVPATVIHIYQSGHGTASPSLYESHPKS
jgi:hypothetical protein